LTGLSSAVTDQSKEQPPLSILVAGGRDVVGALDQSGLPKAGADVFVAGDGSGAMCELLANAYDVIIIDHSLERIDGLRLVALIRSTPALSMLPILIVVEENDELSRLEGLRSGANRAIAKPLQVEVFASSLKEITGA
jgi:PleD family two-component response regulator